MGDATDKNHRWAITLSGRLCLFGWISVILYECFHSFPLVRQLFLAVGPWICLLAFLHALVFFFLHRQGVFLVFMIVSFLPTAYFGIVLKNIAVDHQIGAPTNAPGGELPAEQKE